MDEYLKGHIPYGKQLIKQALKELGFKEEEEELQESVYKDKVFIERLARKISEIEHEALGKVLDAHQKDIDNGYLW